MQKTKLFLSLLILLTLSLPLSVSAQQTSSITTKKYIVVLKDSTPTDSTTDQISQTNQLVPEERYHKVIKGFAAQIPDKRLNKIKADPRVAFVSEDKEVSIEQIKTPPVQTEPTGVERIGANTNSNKGSGIGVAVLDTGIDLTHPDLAANIVAQKNCVRQNRDANDDNGHGSHVAGTIAALDNSIGSVGVAPEAKLIAVKVLNAGGNGTWSSIICGIDWVTANASTYNIKVANMSLGSSGTSDNNCGLSNNDALHQAICRSRDAGITYVVAAGNSKTDTNNFIPASYDDAVIAVSALNDTDGSSGGTGTKNRFGADDTFASFSNFGSSVDIGAPGVNIYSTWKKGKYATDSGTSMATPHVSGSAALYLKSNPGATWIQVKDALRQTGETLGSGHTDPSGQHPEPVLRANHL